MYDTRKFDKKYKVQNNLYQVCIYGNRKSYKRDFIIATSKTTWFTYLKKLFFIQ